MRYHRSTLPHDPTRAHAPPSASTRTTEILELEPFASVGLSPGFSSAYDVVAVSARALPDGGRTTVTFYAMHTTPDDITQPLVGAPPVALVAPVQYVEGTEALTSVRPTCAVYVLEGGATGDGCQLQVVRYRGTEGVDGMHVVELGPESGIVAGELTSITSDDYMGVVYLTATDGTLFVLRFA